MAVLILLNGFVKKLIVINDTAGDQHQHPQSNAGHARRPLQINNGTDHKTVYQGQTCNTVVQGKIHKVAFHYPGLGGILLIKIRKPVTGGAGAGAKQHIDKGKPLQNGGQVLIVIEMDSAAFLTLGRIPYLIEAFQQI